MIKSLETILRKPVREMTLGETIVSDRIPRTKEARMITVVGLMRSEVHLPNPGLIRRDFTTEEQEEILKSLQNMTSRQLAIKIKGERQRLDRELNQQWPRGLTMT